ncbi:hypothetical protein OI25_2926 [Paraburkholderia fungorum]|uniref:Uncharacterized protein n=1 Tax=Paraburkholderia fungorum TaxID=134537 RepID=A0AAU8SZH9_9BURK|nr:hypothetical protein [Paraburkholderia fungorum]AJZ59295.1 hypothetical protein OI25_2926 [Paraburkholderia fungorum]
MLPFEDRYPLPGTLWIPEIGFLLKVAAGRLNELEQDIEVNEICSQGIRKIPKALRRKWMLCFIGTDSHSVTHVARSVVYHDAESGRDKLDIWNLKRLKAPVRISAIKKGLEGPQLWRARRALDAGGSLSPKAFELVMDALKRVNPSAHRIASGLISHKRPPPETGPINARMNWAYQRDAAVTALEIARIPKERLRATPQLNKARVTDATSIFDDDSSMRAIEDVLILRDLDKGDPDWAFVKSQPYPARTFENGDTKLTIVLANKMDLEKQLGVDLIYVNETLGAVVFVQYKMFEGEDGKDGYRPDAQLDKEIARMEAAAAELAKVDPDETCDGYRFCPDPFFLKFCTRLLSHDEKGHVPGAYVTLDYWKRLVLAPRTNGKKGGTMLSPEKLGRRYITPSAFTDLVSRGWVGTSALQAKVLVPFIKDAMKGKKGIVLAVESKTPIAPDDVEARGRTRMPRKPRYPGKRAKVIQL